MEATDQETALAELARRLIPDDPTLVEEVLLAVRHPMSFRERFPERIEQRMWDAWDVFEPWIFGLVDGCWNASARVPSTGGVVLRRSSAPLRSIEARCHLTRDVGDHSRSCGANS